MNLSLFNLHVKMSFPFVAVSLCPQLKNMPPKQHAMRKLFHHSCLSEFFNIFMKIILFIDFLFFKTKKCKAQKILKLKKFLIRLVLKKIWEKNLRDSLKKFTKSV